MNKDFENILDECLDRILLNDETVEQCLRSFPEHADELKPLLDTTLEASRVSDIRPRPEFRERAKYRFIVAAREMEQKKSRSFFNRGWQPRWAVSVITAIVLVLASGGGTVAAASSSMPDDTLYPVKLAAEETRIAFTFSELGKAELYSELADTRVDEIVYLAGEDKPDRIEQTANRLNEHLIAMANNWMGTEAPKSIIVGESALQDDITEGEIIIEKSFALPEEAADSATETEQAPEATSSEEEQAIAPETITATMEAEETEEAAEVPRNQQRMQEKSMAPEAATAAGAGPARAKMYGTEAMANAGTDHRAVVNMNVANNAVNNSARLYAVLDTVPESSRPMLMQAINLYEVNYYQAASNIDNP